MVNIAIVTAASM